jgi:hypothetical protein
MICGRKLSTTPLYSSCRHSRHVLQVYILQLRAEAQHRTCPVSGQAAKLAYQVIKYVHHVMEQHPVTTASLHSKV